ncbi:unnamed protein product, partial [Amoebophrya sp. A25]
AGERRGCHGRRVFRVRRPAQGLFRLVLSTQKSGRKSSKGSGCDSGTYTGGTRTSRTCTCRCCANRAACVLSLAGDDITWGGPGRR